MYYGSSTACVNVLFYFSGACGDKGRCYDLEGDMGYKCTCPVGRSGERCERGGYNKRRELPFAVLEFCYTAIL